MSRIIEGSLEVRRPPPMMVQQLVAGAKMPREISSQQHQPQQENSAGTHQKTKGAKWHSRIELLRKYREQNGHCRVPQRYAIDGVQLGLWLRTQRHHYKKYSQGKPTTITQEKINELRAVGVHWVTHRKRKSDEAKWLSKLELLRQYHEQNGHWQVPQHYAIDGVKLGAWLHSVRHAYKKHSQGVTTFLTQERISQLEALGFNFQQKHEETWQSKVELLRQYHERNGHCRVPLKYEIDGVKLGVWLQSLKYAYKQHSQGKPTVLTQERINRLEALGCHFQQESSEEMWQSKVELLRQYKQANGHCRVPVKYEIHGVKLGAWLHSQRSLYRKCAQGKTTLSTTQEHMDQLKSIGVDFTNNQQKCGGEEMWQSKVELLRQYKQANGHCRVPAKYEVDGVKLGAWLKTQRAQYNKCGQGKTAFLSQERIDVLNTIDLDWNPRMSLNTTSIDDKMTAATGKSFHFLS